MKNIIKKIITIVILAYAFYGIFIWMKYKEQEKTYYSEIQLNLASICNEIMKETYRQYLGPVDFEKNEHKGSVRLIATVYFPNMAPQNIHCSIYLDNFWIGYDENTELTIHFLGTDYAPKNFYPRGYGPAPFIKTTFKALQKTHINASVSPRKKPTFGSSLDEQKI